MKPISEEAKLTLGIHFNNKNKPNSNFLKLDSIKAWANRLLIPIQTHSLKLTT